MVRGSTRPAATAETAEPSGCPIGDLFEVLGRTHTLRILHLFLSHPEGPLRFVDVQSRLSLSPNTVSERLKGLVKAGLLSRTVFQEIPPRVEYGITPKLLDLGVVFDQLETWATRNDLTPSSSPHASGRPAPSWSPRAASG